MLEAQVLKKGDRWVVVRGFDTAIFCTRFRAVEYCHLQGWFYTSDAQ